MDKYSKIEKMLYNYKMLKISLDNLQKDIEFLNLDDGVSGIDYGGTKSSPTYKISSIVENTIISKSEKEHHLTRLIEKNKSQVEGIDKALEGLTNLERIVIEQKYINGKQWWQVASMIGYSEATAKRHRKRAIDKMIVGIYGEKED